MAKTQKANNVVVETPFDKLFAQLHDSNMFRFLWPVAFETAQGKFENVVRLADLSDVQADANLVWEVWESSLDFAQSPEQIEMLGAHPVFSQYPEMVGCLFEFRMRQVKSVSDLIRVALQHPGRQSDAYNALATLHPTETELVEAMDAVPAWKKKIQAMLLEQKAEQLNMAVDKLGQLSVVREKAHKTMVSSVADAVEQNERTLLALKKAQDAVDRSRKHMGLVQESKVDFQRIDEQFTAQTDEVDALQLEVTGLSQETEAANFELGQYVPDMDARDLVLLLGRTPVPAPATRSTATEPELLPDWLSGVDVTQQVSAPDFVTMWEPMRAEPVSNEPVAAAPAAVESPFVANVSAAPVHMNPPVQSAEPQNTVTSSSDTSDGAIVRRFQRSRFTQMVKDAATSVVNLATSDKPVFKA